MANGVTTVTRRRRTDGYCSCSSLLMRSFMPVVSRLCRSLKILLQIDFLRSPFSTPFSPELGLGIQRDVGIHAPCWKKSVTSYAAISQTMSQCRKSMTWQYIMHGCGLALRA
jgi:hypothetical protein